MTLSVRKKRITLLGSLIALVLVVALACSSDDETAPAAATGPTASEIAAAVAATIPEGVSATEISGMIDSALSANPGVSAAELQAAIKAGAGDDLSSADVSAIVKAALNAQPAPQVNTSAIAGLVASAVASAIPEGTDAAEIAALVSTAVEGATSGIATSGDVATAIAAALAGQDNLTADQVAAIVDASLESLRAAVAAQGETIAALELQSLPELGVSEGGFSKVILPELEGPTNIPKNLSREPIQELTYLYAQQAPDGVPPPYLLGSNDEALYRWIFMTPFLLAAPDKDFALRQGYAEGYSLSDDGLTYIYHIRPDAVFQDGTPITAQSVKDAFEFAAWPANQVGWGASLRHTRFIEGISAVEAGDTLTASGLTVIDDLNLKVKLVSVLPTWPMRSTVWTLGLFKAEQAINDPEGFRLNPVGVGPYRASYNDASEKQTFTATENWWGTTPVIKVIHRPTVPDLQVNYLMYENGELDVLFADSTRQPALWDPSNPFNGDLKARGGKDSPSLWLARFVIDHPPFDDPNVRKAFVHAVDMATIIPALLGEQVLYSEGLIVEGNACWRPNTGYVYDPELARQALADSRYGGPEGVPSITIEIARPAIIRIFEVAKEQWKDNLGIDINLVRLEPGQQRRGVVEFRRTSAAHVIPDPSVLLAGLQVDFNNPKLDAMTASALLMPLDTPNYCEVWQEIEDVILDGNYILPLQGGDFASWAAQPWVHGYVASFGDAWGTLPWWVIGTRDRSLYE